MAAVENLGLLLGSAVPSFMDALKFVRQSQENAEQLRIQRAKLAADQRVAVLNQRLRDLQAVDDVRQEVFTQGDTRWNVAYTDAVTNVGEDQANALFFSNGDPVPMTEPDLDSVMELNRRTTASGGGGGVGDGLTAMQKRVYDYYKDRVDSEEQGINSLRTERARLVAERDELPTTSYQYSQVDNLVRGYDRQISERRNRLDNALLDLRIIIRNPDLDFQGVEDKRGQILELSRDGGDTQIGGGDLFQRDVFGPRQQQSYPAGSPLNYPRREVDQGVTPTAQDTIQSRQLLEGFNRSDEDEMMIMGGVGFGRN